MWRCIGVHCALPRMPNGKSLAYSVEDLSIPANVAAYLADVITECGCEGGPLVSLVLFGSTVTGGYSSTVSDVDLLLVLDEHANAALRHRVGDQVAAIETRHGLAKSHPPQSSPLFSLLEVFADRLTANVRASFVCTRADLLSGEPGRILAVPTTQALFIDRVTPASIVASGRTVWGERLLDRVPLLPIRRLDVAKAFFGLFNQVLLSAGIYPLLPSATKYAMGALKGSVHHCYFCYHTRPAPLVAEVMFLQSRGRPIQALTRLLTLRREYRPSLVFILACLPALARLHLRTALELQFPRPSRPIATNIVPERPRGDA